MSGEDAVTGKSPLISKDRKPAAKVKVPLREIKKARTKIALYEASLDLIGTASFRAVKLEDICAKAEVSKVTFFKFYPQKEDLLVYFMYVWLLERLLEIDDGGLRGAAAIRHVLASVAEGAKDRPRLMLSLIGFLSESRMHPCMPTLTDAEMQLLFPGREEQARSTPVDLFAFFRRAVNEAKADGACKRNEPAEVLGQWLTTVFYGAFLTAHMCGQDIMTTYDLHLTILFQGRE